VTDQSAPAILPPPTANRLLAALPDAEYERIALQPMETIFRVLRECTRHDFSSCKPNTLRRRIDRRLAIHAIPTLGQYADFLQHNTQEVDLLFKELQIGVTRFFRDAAVWEYLAGKVVPELLVRRRAEHAPRAWVAGCSSGEEAYSLAIVFTEAMQQSATAHKFDLLACRNLLIYLDAGQQRRLMPLFHYRLRPGGVLLLGTAETVGRFNRLFTQINSKLRT